MEHHLLNNLMAPHIANKGNILMLDKHPEAVLKIFRTHNSHATYTINGSSANAYDFAWINLDDDKVNETVCNMLLNQFPDISIVTLSMCKTNSCAHVEIPLTHTLKIITKLKAPIKNIKFIAPVLQPYNFNLASIKYDDGLLYAFRVSNTKWKESSIIFAYINKDKCSLLNCSNYHQNSDNSYEDPRLFSWNNKLYLMYVHINPYQLGKYTRLLLKVDEIDVNSDLTSVTTVKSYTPPYGKNLEIGPEKNWSFWSSPGNKLICQYAPGYLLEWSDLDHAPRELSKTPLPYNLRGGAPGVIYNDKVYSFCHSPFTMNLGLVVYTNTDNPTPIGIAVNIVKESDYDGAFFYVCGATITDKRWHLTGGITDAACTIIELDVDELDSKIERLQASS